MKADKRNSDDSKDNFDERFLLFPFLLFSSLFILRELEASGDSSKRFVVTAAKFLQAGMLLGVVINRCVRRRIDYDDVIGQHAAF